MEEETITKKKISLMRNAMNYGVIVGIAMIILSLLLYVLNLTGESYIQYLSLALMAAGIIIGILNYRNKINGGFIKYGQSLGTGVMIGLITSVIGAVYTIIFFKFIDPDMINVILKKAEENMLNKNPNMTEEQIEIGMSYVRKFMNPYLMAVTTIISSTFMAFIASLIISIFTRKVDKSFESNFE